jgi:two-component system, NtrC family, sensor kinase
LRLRLLSKLTISINLVLLLFMALFAYINLETIKKLLLEEAVTDADKMSESVIRATHHQMLHDDRERIQQVIKEMGAEKGIDHIRMVNKNGRIIYSTQEDEIGTFLDKKGEACNMCHADGHPLLHTSTMNRSRLFTRNDGKHLLGLAKAIYNEEACYTAKCHFHPERFGILGVLDVTVPLDRMYSQLDSFRGTTIAITILLMGLISLCLTIFIQQLVNQPVQQLLRHTEQLSQGDMDASVSFSSGDELGELAESFNNMTLKLKQARVELEEWAKNLETKVETRTHEIRDIQAQLIRSEKLASLGELVAGIAHEINNPLTGILVFTSLVSKDPKLDPALKNDLETVVQQTQRCSRIVKGLLDFSRESVPQKKFTSLNSIMDMSLSLVERQVLFQNITIIKDYSNDIPDILLDPNQMEQIFINMILNAGQAMHDGGTLHVRTGMTTDDLYEFVMISDTGCGIPEENLVKIFDPFFTTKANKGTGLGLSISYGIINNHGGTIEVNSVVGSGTSFTIKLPIKSEEDLNRGVELYPAHKPVTVTTF